MINFDNYTNENNTEHNEKWPYIPDHPYWILTTGSSGSEKANTLLNFIKEQPVIHNIYLHAKDPYEPKHQFLINKRESAGLICMCSDMYGVYKSIDEYNSSKKCKVLIIFDDMIADMIND